MLTSNKEELELIVSDDNSSNQEVKKIITSTFNNYDIFKKLKVTFQNKNVGPNKHFMNLMTDNIEGDEHIILLNADIIFNPDWFIKFIEAKKSIKDTIGMLTIFNCQKTHPFIREYNELVGLKDTMGACATMFHRDVITHPRMQNFDNHIDWIASEVCNELGLKKFCTKVSWVDHIGHDGINKHADGSIDKATNFQGE
jgi:glycosyltransferase involved in cell wall biosynthesis